MTQNKQQLFRSEAIASRQVSWLGDVVLVRPVSFSILTLIASTLAMLVITFLVFGSYTKRTTVSGQLVQSSGQIRIYPPQYGVLLERFVQEGQMVQRGDPLFRLSSERSGESGPVQASVIEQLNLRHHSLLAELDKQQELQAEERKSLFSKIKSLQQEQVTLLQQKDSQNQLVQIANNAAERYQGLMDKGYISMDQLQQRQAELLGQKQALQSLGRQETVLEQQLVERQHELSGLSALHENQLASLRRALSTVQQELIESEAKLSLFITAPNTGVATAILAEPGQTVDNSRSLMSLLPADAVLEAELYAPSKAVGFIRNGDAVLLRYQAYPYQKFGQHHGVVSSVSRTTLSAIELSNITGSVPGVEGSSEQTYRIKVKIDDQSVMAYGQPHSLQSGMVLEADIFQETRRLYEWVLEPLYSLTGKF